MFPWYPSWSPLLIGFLQRNHLCPQELPQQNLSTFEHFFLNQLFLIFQLLNQLVCRLCFFLTFNFGINCLATLVSTLISTSRVPVFSQDFVIKLWNCLRFLVLWHRAGRWLAKIRATLAFKLRSWRDVTWPFQSVTCEYQARYAYRYMMFLICTRS